MFAGGHSIITDIDIRAPFMGLVVVANHLAVKPLTENRNYNMKNATMMLALLLLVATLAACQRPAPAPPPLEGEALKQS